MFRVLQNDSVIGRLDSSLDERSRHSSLRSLPTDPESDFKCDSVMDSFFKLYKFHNYVLK